jgi:hypothetical protein
MPLIENILKIISTYSQRNELDIIEKARKLNNYNWYNQEACFSCKFVIINII